MSKQTSRNVEAQQEGSLLLSHFLWDHFFSPQEKYPEAVRLPEGASASYMRVQSTSQPG